MKLCSVLIPSRGRIDRLLNSIHSIKTNASSNGFEILVRLDDDDHDSVSRKRELADAGAKIVIGPRFKGWASYHDFLTELSEAATGLFIWMLNDDVLISGQPWDMRLWEAGGSEFVGHTEIHQLNGSVYHRGDRGPFPIVPRNCWKRFGYERIGEHADVWFDKVLHQEQGWPYHFLEGVKLEHQRRVDAILPKERY